MMSSKAISENPPVYHVAEMIQEFAKVLAVVGLRIPPSIRNISIYYCHCPFSFN